MEINKDNRCVKITLPNGKVADILAPVLDEIAKWLQNEVKCPEGGGFIVGYEHKKTGNISLEKVSHPYADDKRSRTFFGIRDHQHYVFLNRAKRHRSYYMGVWHTHPQKNPEPSCIDWADWKETMLSDKTGCQYVFFIIAGTAEWRLWVGDSLTKMIQEVYECPKNSMDIYLREYASKDEEDS